MNDGHATWYYKMHERGGDKSCKVKIYPVFAVENMGSTHFITVNFKPLLSLVT